MALHSLPAFPRSVAWDDQRGVFIVDFRTPAPRLSPDQAVSQARYDDMFVNGPPAPVRWAPTPSERRRRVIGRRLAQAFRALL
jgi:hypothetical protein